MCELLGLNLLCLLSQNRVAEFHTELELFAHPDVHVLENVYIKHAVSLEQYLMEGRYNKVIKINAHPVKYFFSQCWHQANLNVIFWRSSWQSALYPQRLTTFSLTSSWKPFGMKLQPAWKNPTANFTLITLLKYWILVEDN